jgi:oxygen tolerance protein BatD
MTTSCLFYAIITLNAIAQTPVNATATIADHLVPTIETRVDRSEMLIGDVFHLTISITRDPSVQVIQSGADLELGQFTIKEINPSDDEKLDNGKIKQTVDYQLSTFFTGEFEIPAFDILFHTEDGAQGTLRTSPIKITVRSLTPEESEDLDIRDIKEPVLLDGSSRMWIVWTVLVSLIALILLIYFVRRYFKNKKNIIPAEPPLPPDVEAYQALQALRENRDWLDNRDYEFFSTRVSEIIRLYTSRRWIINALDETSDEIMMELKAIKIPLDIINSFYNFFTDCDLMKFAKHQLPTDELEGLIDQAKSIVDHTSASLIDTVDQTGDQSKNIEDSSENKDTPEPKVEPVEPVDEA